MKKDHIRISKFLSLVLRHRPKRINIQLDEQGWVSVDELLTAMRKHAFPLSLEILREVVASNDKQRFAFSEDGTLIRASQGHSVKIDLAYQPLQPPEILFHGTARKFLPSIRQHGLIKKSRHHVHLSPDRETARRVGSRHGTPVILEVQAGEMHRAGIAFFQSENGVWLVAAVAVAYLDIPES